MARTVAILTDFGLQDNYVAIMKGVIKTISPFANIIDLNNNIPQGDIDGAAYQLQSAYRYFPPNTIFLCVVDPGVGTNRKAIAVETDNYFFVSPDNGLLTPILQNEKILSAVELNNPKFYLPQVSNTFHGRDIFAPVAAHISQKSELLELGTKVEIDSLITLKNMPIEDENTIEGRIIHTDNFGNLITNIDEEIISKKKELSEITVAGYRFSELSNTFSDKNVGELLAYIGSSGRLEIAMNGARASDSISRENPVKIIFNI